MKFFVGLHMPSHAGRFDRCMVSVNRLRKRKSGFQVREWMMDSGMFTQLRTAWGRATGLPVIYAEEYAEIIRRFAPGGEYQSGRLLCAVAQDFMCERELLGPDLHLPGGGYATSHHRIGEHVGKTVHWYIRLLEHFGWRPPVHIMPVLQGYEIRDYLHCIGQYGPLLKPGMWVGVGSVCKRNAKVSEVEAVLTAIYRARPDLRLHGFGLKATALASDLVRRLLYSADSMAWSWAARREGRDSNDPAEAERYVDRLHAQPVQGSLLFDLVRAEVGR